MSDGDDLDLDDLRSQAWPERWRHPRLLAELDRQGSVDDDKRAAAQAWLRDLAYPPRDPDQAVRTLVEHGHLAAAARLVDDVALWEREGSDPAAAAHSVSAALAAEQQEQRRREHELAARAHAAGLTVSHEPGAASVDDQVSRGEQQRREVIERLLAAAGFEDGAFDDLVRSCLDAREYAAAEQLLATGPTGEIVGGPALVRRPRPWPYPEPIDTVLGWFDDTTGRAPRDFDRRQPPAEDEAGRALVAALRSAWAALDASSARTLAEALDGMLVDGPVTHRPVQLPGGGFQVRAYGLGDPRLPWLGLRSRVALTIGPQPPDPAAEIGVWLPLADPGPTERISHVAVVTAQDLLEIVAPTSSRRPGSQHYRRINLLRRLCRGLPADAVVNHNPGDLGNAAEMRETITWMLDMMGLRPLDPALPDVVVYDASGLPAAVCAIVRELGARTGRPGDLTLKNLGDLRADQAAVRRIRAAVTAPLGDDYNALVVLGALILGQAVPGSGTVDEAVLEAELAELGAAAEPRVEVEHVDVPDGLRRLNTAGLVTVLPVTDGTGRQAVRFCGPGLAALLQDDGLLADTLQRLQELSQLALERARAARIAVESQTSHSYRHVYANYVFIQRQLAHELARPDLSMPDRARITGRLSRVGERIATLELAQQGSFDELAARDFDLRDTLAEFRRLHDYEESPASIDMRFCPGLPETLPVRGIEELVQLALDDLVVNAHRAMERAGSAVRMIRVTVGIGDRETERVAVLDIEDSGPGFSALAGPDVERERAGLRGGDGMANAATALRSCRGELERVPDQSELGGAHVRVRLPLTC